MAGIGDGFNFFYRDFRECLADLLWSKLTLFTPIK